MLLKPTVVNYEPTDTDDEFFAGLCRLSREQYAATFDLKNLMPVRGATMPVARERALELLTDHAGLGWMRPRTLFIGGASDAFGLVEMPLLRWIGPDNLKIATCPAPDSMFWRDQGNAARAAAFWQGLVKEATR